ncbi:unnamed protein product [Caenorhabditis auriculariae]|uniref:Schlafen AlbA-2 domain-containing protein n=1 Tax=Caenorhabditis auriculariae TaxID=2777116 RepID=A0A8S1GS67_9PELO|nr:unnamed protein product [Caenorhabditis auriculariae]
MFSLSRSSTKQTIKNVYKYGEKTPIDEDTHNEFRMHSRLLLSEVSQRKQKQDKDGSIRRTLQPISKTICAFLNSEGGRIYVGVDGEGTIKGVTMSDNMVDHFFGSLRIMCEKFRPISPINFIKVSVFDVVDETRDGIPKGYRNSSDDEEDFAPEFRAEAEENLEKCHDHSIGGVFCHCERDIFRGTHLRLLVVEVKKPNSRKPIIFQNEEGLAYRRRLASNKCLYFDDVRRMMQEREKIFPLEEEEKEKLDSFLDLNNFAV